MTDMNELFKDVDWTKEETQEDFDTEIKPLRGDYKGEIKKFSFYPNKEDESKGSFLLSAQICETVKGNDGGKRFQSRFFQVGEDMFGGTAEDNFNKLKKALASIGATSPEDAVGKIVCMKLRPNTYRDGDKKGEVKRDGSGFPKQIMTIVKEFKGATDSANVTDAGSGKMPF